MREDLLKEQLMGYARDGAEAAVQPSAAEIYRRARRHYQKVAALAVTGVLAAAGVGAALGLRGATPTANPPLPPATDPGPAVASTTATTRPPATSTTRPPSTTRAAAAAGGKVPGTFVAEIGGRVVVRSTATGKVVRTLRGPHPSGLHAYAVGSSPDRKTVWFSTDAADAADPCREPGIFRVPSDGGPPTRVVAEENATRRIATSADGSRLAYLGSACPSADRLDVVLRDASGALLHRWAGPDIKDPSTRLVPRSVSLSPDGRQVAVTMWEQLTPVGVRLLDATRGTSISDGRLITAPDPGCVLADVAFQPGTGRLAAFERCPRPGSTAYSSGTPPRFQLLYLDPGSGRLLSRSLEFEDRTGADLDIETMDFDQTGRHLLYAVGSHDPMDYQEPRPATGTWRYGGGRPVRIPDDRRLQRVGTDQFVPAVAPSW
jgi:hypothetical protein